MQKRGLSSIIASVLIILLVIIAMGVLWAILKPKIIQSAEEIDSSLLTVDMKIDKVVVNENLTSVKIERKAGQGQVNKIRIVISNETDSQVASVPGLQEMESRTYIIQTSVSNPSKIEIAPILVKDDKERIGMKTDEYIIREETIKDTPSIPVNPPSPTCPGGLVSYWKFENNVLDTRGLNNGTINGNVNLVDGKVGKAYSFTGGYIDVGKDSSLNIQGPITVEAWVKINSGMTNSNYYYNVLGKQTIYVKGYGINIAAVYNAFQFWTRGSGSSASGWDYTNEANIINKWIHLVGVFDGTRISFYVNGTLIGNNNGVASGDTSTCPLRIGNTGCPGGWGQYADQSFNGVIDEVSIWNKALTSLEVQDHYNSGNGKELC